MTLPKLPSVADIHSRLERLFTPGLEMRKNLVREMEAKTVFVFLYGSMVDSADRCLRPSHVYFFTEDQAQKSSDEDRLLRKGTQKAEHPHEPPGPPKNYGADINTLIELLESGRL